MKSATESSAPSAKELPAWTQLVMEKASALRFGSIQIILHEGRVIQVESTEKIRLSPPGRDALRAG